MNEDNGKGWGRREEEKTRGSPEPGEDGISEGTGGGFFL